MAALAVLLAVLLAAGCSRTGTAGPDAAHFAWAGIWCWGSARRSADVPFLRISEAGAERRVETKHYMHDYFESRTKEVRFDDDRLAFEYWYAPRARWAHCALAAPADRRSDDRLAGTCEGEVNVRDWGEIPSYLWRCDARTGRDGQG